MARKSKKKGDLVSALQLAQLLGRDRASLVRWVENEGMPFESRPDAAGAGEWRFYTAEVVDWIERRAEEKVRAQYATPWEDGDMEDQLRNPRNEEEAKRADAISTARKRYWDAIKAADSAAEERGQLVRRDTALAVFDAKIQGLKGDLYNLAPQVALEFDDPDEKVRVTQALDARLRDLLYGLSISKKEVGRA